MEKERIERAVQQALDNLFRCDTELLILDANERSISHRLAIYLDELFPGWNVDCEYNRDIDEPKRLDLVPRNIISSDTQATTVFPDIIIHRRGTNQNLLVIEMKKSTNPEGNAFDFQKLNAFKNQLGYKFAVFIKLQTGISNPCIENIEWV